MYILARKSGRISLNTKSMPKCDNQKVEAQLRLVLDNGLTNGEWQGSTRQTVLPPYFCKQGKLYPLCFPSSHILGLATAWSAPKQADAEISASVGSKSKIDSLLAVKSVWAFHPQMCFLWPSCATLCSTGLQNSFSSVNSSISYVFTLGNAGKVSVCFKWNVTTVRSYWEKMELPPS